MSSLNLNLLPSQAKFQAQKIRWLKMSKGYVVIFVSLWLVVVVGVYGLNWVVGRMVKTETGQVEALELEVKVLSQRALTEWQLKNMAGMVARVINSRFEYGQTFERVSNFISNSLGSGEMELREGKLFSINGKGVDSRVIDELEKKVIEINQGRVEGFSRATLTSLKLTNGEWSYSLELSLK